MKFSDLTRMERRMLRACAIGRLSPRNVHRRVLEGLERKGLLHVIAGSVRLNGFFNPTLAGLEILMSAGARGAKS